MNNKTKEQKRKSTPVVFSEQFEWHVKCLDQDRVDTLNLFAEMVETYLVNNNSMTEEGKAELIGFSYAIRGIVTNAPPY